MTKALRVVAIHIYPGESWEGPDGTIHTNDTDERIDLDPLTQMPIDASTEGGEPRPAGGDEHG